jgi:hypothetical protein
VLWTPLARRCHPLHEVGVNTETLLEASKKAGLEIVSEETAYDLVSSSDHRKLHNIETAEPKIEILANVHIFGNNNK